MNSELGVFNDPDVILAQTQAAVSVDPLLINVIGGAVTSVGGALGPTVLVSTSNGVTASAAANTLTLSMTQDLRVTASPTFAGLTWSGYGGSAVLLRANSSGALAAVTIGANLSFDGTTLSATGGGSGSGTVNSGTANQLAYYASTGTAVSGLTSANDSVLVTNGSGVPSWATSLPSGTTLNGVAIVTTTGTQTLTNKTISGASNTLSNIANASLTNSAITIAGTSTSLGGSITLDTITGLSSTGLVKRTGANTLAIATSGTDYEVPLTFSTGLTRSTNTVTVNTTQNIAKLSNLTSNGFVKTSSGDGTLSVDTSTYLTANQTITLSGDVSGSGSTAITTVIGSNKVTNAMLATVATATLKGRTTAGTGNVEDLTATQATALLNAMVGDSGAGGTKGLVPAPASGDAAANKFLKADGAWTAVGATVSGANPTASVGLTAVNGVATTFLRSDGAPALSQSIAPTWTGLHTFNPGTTPQDAIFLDIAALGSNGARDSHNIVLRGRSRNGTDHPIDWKIFNDVTTSTDLSQLTFSNQVNGGGYTDLFIFADDGTLNAVAFVGDGSGLTSIDGGQVVNVVGSTNGGAGSVSGILKANGSGTVTAVAIGTGISFDGTTLSATGSGGTVTTVSVVSTNGFAGSVANATTTPAITLTTSITGVLKGDGTAISAAAAGTDYEVPLTFSTGLTRSTNTITVNTTQNITKLSNLTSNGFVKTSGGDGTLSVDTSTYLTGNQTITLSGDVSGSGTTGITATIANDAVTYAKMQNVSATDRLLGRSTSGAGDVEEITCTAFARSILDDADAATVRATIGAGTGSGTVTSVAQSFTGGLISVSGSPITSSGTLALTVAGTSGGIPYFSSASAWASSAALTANAIVLGGGAGAAPKVVTGLTTDGTSKINLGVAGSSVGAVAFANATSGSVTLQPVTGALGTVTLTMPATTGTLSLLSGAEINGLIASWVSTTQISIGTGSCYIQSLGAMISFSSATTLTPTVTTNTWYYVYAYLNSGTPSFEVSTTAPASPYFGTARSKTSDTSRRFVFCFKTGSSSQIFKFVYNALTGEFNYQEQYDASPWRVVGPGQATSFTTVDCSAVVPPVSEFITMRVQNYNLSGTTSNLFITIPSDTATSRLIVNPGADSTYSIATDSSQDISYKLGGSGATGIGGFYGDVKAFFFGR